ncbi:MAG TPA: lipopolysaccharide biosynthesis protein [Gaiellaceae bacterium]|nr:lipopolysaccharide biosynthesis protein [Gaiellaceae bacterium]
MTTGDDFDEVVRGADEVESRDGASLRTRAAKGVFWTATGAWGRQLALFVVIAIQARLLEPTDFGLVAFAAVFVGFTHVIADEGLADALIQRKELERAHLDAAFWTTVGFAVVLTLILAALAVPIAALLGDDELAPVLVVLSLSIPIASTSLVQRAILTRELKFRSLALRSLCGITVGGICGVIAAFSGLGVWSLVIQNLAGVTTGTLVLWRVTDFRPRLTFSSTHCRDLLGFGSNVVGFRLLIYFTRWADELLIGAFLGPAALGFYTVGNRMLRMLIQVTSSLIDRVSFPLYSRLQDKPARLKAAFYKSTSFAALIAFPVFLATAVLAPQVVELFFGAKWADSIPVMQILAFFGLIQVLTYLNGTTIKALGKPGWLVIIVGITAALKVGAFLVAVQYGLIAVAVAATCVGWIVAPLYYRGVKRLVDISFSEYWRSLRVPVVGSILSAATMLGFRYLLDDARPLVVLAVAGAVGAAVYYAAVRLLAPPLAGEVRDLVSRGLPSRGFGRPKKPLTEGDS